MSERVPAWLEPTIDRITEPRTLDADGLADEAATGALADLLLWWRQRSIPYSSVTNAGGNDAGIWKPVAAETVVGAGVIADGIAAADRGIDSGATLVVPRVVDRDNVASRAIVAVLCNRDAAAVLHQPESMTDREWMEECIAIRDAANGAAHLKGTPIELVERLGTPAHQYAVGVLLGSAARATPCIIDGIDLLAAALVADRLAFRASRWWRLGSRSPDPGVVAAAERIDIDQGLALDLTDDAGFGARSTLALLELLLS